MVKMVGTQENGTQVVMLGLSWANLDRLRADGLKGFMNIRGVDIGVPVDIIITAAETEHEIADLLIREGFVGPDTKVNISDKLKSS